MNSCKAIAGGKNKSVSGKGSQMNNLGKVIWRECASRAACTGVLNILEFVSDNIVPIGAKTFRRRLNEGNWNATELSALQSWLQSPALWQAINHEYQLQPDVTKLNDFEK